MDWTKDVADRGAIGSDPDRQVLERRTSRWDQKNLMDQKVGTGYRLQSLRGRSQLTLRKHLRRKKTIAYTTEIPYRRRKEWHKSVGLFVSDPENP